MSGLADMIPELLTSIDRWILWRNVTRGKRVTKEPHAYRGGLASTTKPSDWTSWNNVQHALERTKGAWDGPGIVLGDLGNGEILAGLDLDRCLVDGAVAEWAKPYLRALTTYAEISPSGTGLKLFFRAKAADLAAARRMLGLADNEHGRKKTYGQSANGHPPAAELYLSARYFAVTGDAWPGCQEEIAVLSPSAFSALADLLGKRETAGNNNAEDITAPDAATLLRKVEQAKKRNRALRERWEGDKSGLKDTSRSGFDMSLGTLLKACGFTYGEMRASLIANQHGAGAESDERYFQRIWERSSVEPNTAEARGNGPDNNQPRWREPEDISELILTYFDQLEKVIESNYIVEDLLDEASSAVVYGESNCGKTFWASDLALHIASGLSWNEREVIQGGVVYVSLEGNRGFCNRVAAWKQEKAEDRLVCFAAIQQSVNLLDPKADTGRLIAAIKKAGEQFGMPVKLVVIDTLARAMAGGNENASEDMGALVGNMDRIRAETGAAVLFIHHCGKDAAKGARGHSSLRAAIDTEVEVVAIPGTRIATVVKQREMETTGAFNFELEIVKLGENKRGKSITSCVVRATGHVAGHDTGHGFVRDVRVRISGHQLRAFELLTNSIATSGRTGDQGCPSGISSIPETWWRDTFYANAMPGATPEAKQKAFRRAADYLVEHHLVGMGKGRVWIAYVMADKQPDTLPDKPDKNL